MDRRLPWWKTVLVACVMLWTVAANAAGEPPDRGDDAALEGFQKYAKETAARYEFRSQSNADRKFSLIDESILRWTNPVGGMQAHGEVFLWTDRGRPAAVLSLYQVTEAGVVHEHHEFCSLSLEGLTGQRSGQPAWSPAEAGVELKAFPEGPAVQDSARLRMVQMRRLAEQLQADKTTREGVKRELRLLPKPVYRYESSDPDILDGALFSFVEATDPEVFLLIEARSKGKDEYEWRYGLGRMNSVRLRVLRGEQILWEAAELRWRDALDRPDKAYTVLRIR
jgi:hypothetical protein